MFPCGLQAVYQALLDRVPEDKKDSVVTLVHVIALQPVDRLLWTLPLHENLNRKIVSIIQYILPDIFDKEYCSSMKEDINCESSTLSKSVN